MTWVQRLKRVFGIDIETCPACGGAMWIIACIEDPDVVERILAHLDARALKLETAGELLSKKWSRTSAGRNSAR